MTKNAKIYLLIGAAFVTLLSGVFAISVLAQDPFDELTYPIIELGSCENKQDCKFYCSKPENRVPCIEFAEQHQLMPKEDIEMNKKMLALGEIEGPGGCMGMEECKLYCDNMDHMEECIAFAEEHGLMLPDEMAEAKKILSALKKGIKMPNCDNKEECDAYCSSPEHMEECMTFSIEAGLMPPHEIEESKKMLAALKRGIKPPDCRGREECDAYCSAPENMEECMTFSIEAGFMPPEEVENMKKTLEAIKKGVPPPNCHSEEECDIYCSQEEHFQECIDFSEAAGFMSPEEIDMARKTGGRGPGGCMGEEECKAFCENPDNDIVCVKFGLEHGLLTPEEEERALHMLEFGKQGSPGNCQNEQECEMFCSKPENFPECMKFGIKVGEVPPTPGDNWPGIDCQGEECKTYCDDPAHAVECIERAKQMGEISPEQAEQMFKEMEMMQVQTNKMGPEWFEENFEDNIDKPLEYKMAPQEGEFMELPKEWEKPEEWKEPGQWQEPKEWEKPQDWIEPESQGEQNIIQQVETIIEQIMPPELKSFETEAMAPEPTIEKEGTPEALPKPQTFLGPIELFFGQILDFLTF